MSMKDDLIFEAVKVQARDVEDSLETLVAQGIPIEDLALRRDIEVGESTIKLTTAVVRKR